MSETPLHPVPVTLEGSAVLHQMLRLRWDDLHHATSGEAAQKFAQQFSLSESEGEFAAYSLFGHKGDLLFIHFQPSFDELKRSELAVQQSELWKYVEQASSYLSVVELGLYESSLKTYRALAEQGLKPNTPDWDHQVSEMAERQREAMKPRLHPRIPDKKFACFYPMNRLRGESKNWYTLPIEERQRQMDLHGQIGRRYAGKVQQIITGSIGFDDWEWGVDLFADDPLVFKRLIYEMRFDEVSAVYAQFGTFYVGTRVPVAQLAELFKRRPEE